MSVSLPEPMKVWVENQARDGGFGTVSNYVRHLVRRDQERQEKITALQAEIAAGLESGSGEAFEADSFRSSVRERYGR